MSTAFVFVFCLSAKCHKVCLYRQKRQISWKSSHTVFMGSPCFRWKLLSLLFTNLSSDARPFHIPDGIDAPSLPLTCFHRNKKTNKRFYYRYIYFGLCLTILAMHLFQFRVTLGSTPPRLTNLSVKKIYISFFFRPHSLWGLETPLHYAFINKSKNALLFICFTSGSGSHSYPCRTCKNVLKKEVSCVL